VTLLIAPIINNLSLAKTLALKQSIDVQIMPPKPIISIINAIIDPSYLNIQSRIILSEKRKDLVVRRK